MMNTHGLISHWDSTYSVINNGMSWHATAINRPAIAALLLQQQVPELWAAPRPAGTNKVVECRSLKMAYLQVGLIGLGVRHILKKNTDYG